MLAWNQIYEAIAGAAGEARRLVHIPSEFIARVNPHIGSGLFGDKAHSTVFDNTKIKRLVPGFQCTIPFVQGMRESIAYLDAHREKQRTERDQAIEEILAMWGRSF